MASFKLCFFPQVCTSNTSIKISHHHSKTSAWLAPTNKIPQVTKNRHRPSKIWKRLIGTQEVPSIEIQQSGEFLESEVPNRHELKFSMYSILTSEKLQQKRL